MTPLFKSETFVAVGTGIDGDLPGLVKYTCPDGYVGVAIVGEKGRVDEWAPRQLRAITPKEAALMTRVAGIV